MATKSPLMTRIAADQREVDKINSLIDRSNELFHLAGKLRSRANRLFDNVPDDIEQEEANSALYERLDQLATSAHDLAWAKRNEANAMWSAFYERTYGKDA